MSPGAQQAAIAKACGWSAEDVERGYSLSQFGETIPYYPTDLNAMREAVTSRCNNSDAGTVYGSWLVKIVLGYDFFTMPGKHQLLNAWELTRLANATAAQRAEAFLRTLNLWRDDE